MPLTHRPSPHRTQATSPGALVSEEDGRRDPDSGFSSVGRVFRGIRGEETDDYPPVIARLNERWRVIACRGSIQWILQRRSRKPDSWRGCWFCRTREALIRGARAHADHIGGDALVLLLRLPERFPDNGTGA